MQPRRLIPAASGVLAALLAGSLLSACGGSKPPATSTTGAPSGGSFKQFTADAYKHSSCMRKHGVTGFPDPTVTSNTHGQVVGIHLTPAITGAPAFKSAQSACAYLMPTPQGNNIVGPSAAEQKAHEVALVAFAKCMRTRGFSRFPDPDQQGRLTLAMIQRAGINLQAPAVRPAADACVPLTHGIITRADVNQAIENPTASSSESSARGG